MGNSTPNEALAVFNQIKDLDYDVVSRLDGPIKHSTFARVTG